MTYNKAVFANEGTVTLGQAEENLKNTFIVLASLEKNGKITKQLVFEGQDMSYGVYIGVFRTYHSQSLSNAVDAYNTSLQRRLSLLDDKSSL